MLHRLKSLAKRSRLARALARRLRVALGVPDGTPILPAPAGPTRSDRTQWVVDAALAAPGVGVLVMGWCLDPARELVQLSIVGADDHDILRNWSRHLRADVVAAHPDLSRGTTEAGYLALVRLPGPLPARVTLRARFRSGAREEKDVNVAQPGDPLAFIQTLLSIAPLPSVGIRALVDRHLGPTIEAVWATRPADRPTGAIRWYGAPPAAPRVSILIPLYGRYDFMRYQLALMAGDPDLHDAELIYVCDDPRIDGEVATLADMIQPLFGLPFALVTAHRNLGYAGANNLGARHARGEYLLLLNSDVMPRDAGWCGGLIEALTRTPGAGIVAPTLIYEDGAIQHVGMQTEPYGPWDGLPINTHPRKGLPLGMLPDGPQPVEGVTGACLLTRRALYEQLGGLDEGYILGDFEDSDFCHRARAAGAGIHWIPDIVLYHLERQSQNLFDDTGWKSRVTLYNCWRHERLLRGAA